MLITTVHKCEALTKLDFPGTPVVKIPCYQCKDRFDPWLKNKDPTCHSLVQFSCSVMSVDPMYRSTPGLPVHHQLPEFTQTHVHWVGDAIQPSHPVVPFSSCSQSFPASGSFQMSQLFASGGQSIGSFSFNISPSNKHPGLIKNFIEWVNNKYSTNGMRLTG